MKTNSITNRIVEAIRRIPPGRVATYGQIALIAGNPRASRLVVWVLHAASEKENLPWHRVVNRNGKISLKRGFGYDLQKKLLQKEGITFDKDDTIDFNRFLWEPID